MVWFVVDSAVHVYPHHSHVHVHTQLPKPTWKIWRSCACELRTVKNASIVYVCSDRYIQCKMEISSPSSTDLDIMSVSMF